MTRRLSVKQLRRSEPRLPETLLLRTVHTVVQLNRPGAKAPLPHGVEVLVDHTIAALPDGAPRWRWAFLRRVHDYCTALCRPWRR